MYNVAVILYRMYYTRFFQKNHGKRVKSNGTKEKWTWHSDIIILYNTVGLYIKIWWHVLGQNP